MSRQPALFVGHGSPMNAIDDNPWSRALRALGQELPRPRAVLAVSAHWYLPGTFVTAAARPATIHDFGGFPRALHEVEYPAPGDVELARRVVRLLGEERAAPRGDWGLDHGSWSVLRHLFPEADVPVVQLSLDERLAPAGHLALGRALAPLRDDGVLLLASGNLTHNLRHAMQTLGGAGPATTPAWAAAFDAAVAAALERRDAPALLGALDGPAGRMAHPSPEHYLPLLYAAGASDANDSVTFPIVGFDAGSLSMRSVRFG